MSEQKSIRELMEKSNGKNKEVLESSSDEIGKIQELEKSLISGWELKKLGNLLSLEYGENLPERDREEGNIPVFGSNGQVDTHSEAYVDQSGIIIGRKGSIGEIEFSPNDFWPIDTTYYITKEQTDENLLFLYYLLQKIQLSRLNAASAIPGLNRNDVYGLNALVPSLSEQEKIASVLYNVDRAIQKTEEIIEQTKRVKKGLMQDLFTEGYFEHEKYDDHPTLGRYPFNWNIEEISKVSYIEMGSSPKSEFYNKEGEGMPFFQGNNEFGFKYPEVEVWCSNPQKKAKKGDILLSVRAPVGDLNIANQACCIGRGLAAIKAKKVDRDYLYFHLNERKKFLKRIATGSTYDSINSKDLKNLEIKIPSKEEQEKISETLVNLDRQLLKEKENKERLKLLKKGLMQDLLTGKVRTKDKPIEVLPEVKSHG